MAKVFNVAVKWRNFAKSGHTGCLLADWRPPHFIFPVNKIELFCLKSDRVLLPSGNVKFFETFFVEIGAAKKIL